MSPRSTTRSHSSVRTMSSSPIIAAGDVAVLLEESNGDERLPTSANDVAKDNERCTEATKEPGGRERDGLPARKGRTNAQAGHRPQARREGTDLGSTCRSRGSPYH